MPARQLKIENNCAIKYYNISSDIPIFHSLYDFYKYLDNINNTLTKLEKLAIAQNLNEFEIYSSATAEERQLIAPILNSYYRNNILVLEMPIFTPLLDDKEIWNISENQNQLELFHCFCKYSLKHKYKDFIRKTHIFCEKYDLCEDDIFQNLNNLGYNKNYGIRIIDYGLTEEMAQKF